MEKIVYETFKTSVQVEEEKVTSYGIRALDGTGCVASLSDVCADAQMVEDLARLCTFLELDPKQLGEVVEDFLTDIAV